MPKNDKLHRARGVINVNALVVAALGLGLLSNVLVAALFGLSHRVAAFFAAMVLPNLFMALCIAYLGIRYTVKRVTLGEPDDQFLFTEITTIDAAAGADEAAAARVT